MIPDLITRIEALGGGDRRTDGELDGLVGHENEAWPPAYTASVDAALMLVERMRPDFGITVKAKPEPFAGHRAEAWLHRSHPTNATYEDDGATPALALLAALLRSLADTNPAEQRGDGG